MLLWRKRGVFWLFWVFCKQKPQHIFFAMAEDHLHPSTGSTSVAVFLWKKHGSRLLYIPASCDLTFAAWAELVCRSGLYSVKRHGLWAKIPNCSPSKHFTTTGTSVNLWRFHQPVKSCRACRGSVRKRSSLLSTNTSLRSQMWPRRMLGQCCVKVNWSSRKQQGCFRGLPPSPTKQTKPTGNRIFLIAFCMH